jgi:restriction system protein
MAIPDYQTIMLPLLESVKDKQEHSIRELNKHITEIFNLSEEEKRERIPSGQQTIIYNRVGWSSTYLKKAGLLESTQRGYIRITDRGIEVLRKKPSKIDVEYLKQFPEFIEFRTIRKKKKADSKEPLQTPQELIEEEYQKINYNLAQEILKAIKKNDPSFLEKLVVDLLVKMGYGGTQKDPGVVIGRIGDEGLDGKIKEDRLGLDNIYIQAKNWENTVGRREIQQFVGALQGPKLKKGIFITTSKFSKGAKEYAENMGEPRIILIDGEELTKLMIENDIGVSTKDTYEIKQIVWDYFSS